MGRSSSISPLNFIEALSLALDLASDGLSAHHTRTAVIAYKIGRELGLVAQELQTLTYASLLHDIGAAANWNERKLDVSQGEDIYCHAEKGYQLLKNSRLFGAVARGHRAALLRVQVIQQGIRHGSIHPRRRVEPEVVNAVDDGVLVAALHAVKPQTSKISTAVP